jgi:hypothetical protein
MPSTPGPWEARCIGYWDSRDQYAIMAGDIQIATVESADPVGDDDEDHDPELGLYGPLSEGNANLLASAPDLFIALSGAVKMLEHIQTGGYYMTGEYHDRLISYCDVLARAEL